MRKYIRRIATPGFWFSFKQLLIQKDIPQALFSIGITMVCFLVGSAALQWLYASKIATQPLSIISSIVFTSLVVTAIAFWVMKASFKFHIAISEKLDKVIDFSYAMKSLGLYEFDDQLTYIAKQKIPLYVSKKPITNTYIEYATVKRYTLLRDKEKIKYYKGDDRLCINAATYDQIMQDRAKEISSLESAALAKKEEEMKSLAETLASKVAQVENLQKENTELRNICKTQSGRERAIANSSIRRVVFWRVAGPLLNTLCEQGSRDRPYTRTDIQAAFDTAMEDFPALKGEIKQILLAGKKDAPSEAKNPKPKSDFDLTGWAMEAMREGLGDLAKREAGAVKKR